MNGFWESYGETPVAFINAYRRIFNIFYREGVTRNSIYWSFAPNGWSSSYKMEKYYPGDQYVDVVAYSTYNFGYCDITDWPKWQNANALHRPYIDEIKKLAPFKPIIVSQIASTSETEKGYNLNEKNQWLLENYHYLASVKSVIGVLYFNIDKECDWSIYQGNNRGAPGYQKAVQHNNIRYVHPDHIHQYFR